MKGVAFSGGMAASLGDRGMFEGTVGGDGLKDFRVDSPTAATELMNEQRRDRAQLEIGGVEVGAGLCYGGLAFGPKSVLLANCDAAMVFDTNRFDDPHPTIGDRPIEVRQVPVLNLPARLRLNAGGRVLGATLRLTQ